MLRMGRSSNVGVNAHRFEQNSRNPHKCDASVEIRTAHPNLLLPNELLHFWAAARKGRCPVGHRGEPLRPSDITHCFLTEDLGQE